MLKTLTVKEGQHDFKPSFFPWPRLNRELHFEFVLTESCWYDSLGSVDPEKNLLRDKAIQSYHADNYDFNKAVGLYQWLDFAKNFNAFMLAWRPKLDEMYSFECVPYENRDKAILANEDKIRVYKAGDVIKGYFKPSLTGCELYLILEEGVILWHKSKLSTWLYGIVDSWFGGNNVAMKEMEVKLSIKSPK